VDTNVKANYGHYAISHYFSPGKQNAGQYISHETRSTSALGIGIRQIRKQTLLHPMPHDHPLLLLLFSITKRIVDRFSSRLISLGFERVESAGDEEIEPRGLTCNLGAVNHSITQEGQQFARFSDSFPFVCHEQKWTV
jgi:hypothetical protein